MVQSFNQQPNENDTELDLLNQDPLGIKKPLLPSHTLGQTTLQLQVLHPLGTTSILRAKAPVSSSSKELNDPSEIIHRKASGNLQINLRNPSQEETNLSESSPRITTQLKPEISSTNSKSKDSINRDAEITVGQMCKVGHLSETVPTVLENLVQPSSINFQNYLNNKSLMGETNKDKNSFSKSETLLRKPSKMGEGIQRKSVRTDDNLESDGKRGRAIAQATLSNQIINRAPNNTLQKSTQDIPTTWSNLEDLIAKNTNPESVTPIQRSSQQKQSPDISEDLVFTPKGFQLANDTANTAHTHQSVSSSIQPKPNYHTNHHSAANKTILQTKSNYSSQENIADLTSAINSYNEDKLMDNQVTLGKESLKKEVDAKNFEELAREIYNLLRQRLEIERERQGNSSSSRLTW